MHLAKLGVAIALVSGCSGGTAGSGPGDTADAQLDTTVADAPFGDGAPPADGTPPADSAPPDAAPDLIDDSAPVCTASCGVGTVCVGSLCCPAPTASGAFSLPAHTSYVNWSAGPTPVARYDATVRIYNNPGIASGHFLAPVSAYIGTQQFYFGIQSDLYKPGVGYVGKGVIFSRFGTTSLADIRLGPTPGGYSQGDTYEGPFVGIRLPYAWGVGDYVLRLQRAEADGNADWFELHVINVATGVDTDVGGIRFPRTTVGVPATMTSNPTGFMELYSGAQNYSTATRWHVGLMLTANGAPVPSASSAYPAYPTAVYPNVDTFYDPVRDRVHITHGGQTPKCHPAGALFTH